MLQPCIVYIIWRLKRILYVFITLFIVLLKKKKLAIFICFCFFWVGKQALLLVFVLLLARTADLKTGNSQRRRERAGRTLPLTVSPRTAPPGQSALIWRMSSAKQPKKWWDMVPALASPSFTAAQFQAPPTPPPLSLVGPLHHVSHLHFPQSLTPPAEGPAPFPDLTSTIWPFACHALHDNALISSRQRTWCQSDKR